MVLEMEVCQHCIVFNFQSYTENRFCVFEVECILG